MASVNSPIRKLLKPLLYKLLSKRGYEWLQYYGKIRDIKYRLVEEKEMELLPRLIRPHDEVIDIGANYVYYSIRMSPLAKLGTVHAFEPVVPTYKIAQRLLKYFKIHNVNLHSKGIGDQNKKVSFTVPVQDFGFMSAGLAHVKGRDNSPKGNQIHYRFNKDETVECDVVRLDDFLFDKLSNLTFIKMDIEGAEYSALKGMVEIIQKFKPVILVEMVPFYLEGYNINISEYLNFIQSLGYQKYLYDPKSKKLKQKETPLIESNYILIHKNKIEDYGDIIHA